MKFFLLTLLFTFYCSHLDIVEAVGYSSLHWRLQTDWSYIGATGPSNWCKIGFEECCGQHQSPIDVNTEYVQHFGTTTIELRNYDQLPKRILMKNIADTVRLTFEPKVATTKFSDSSKTYVLDNIHFHWGSDSSVGCEHTVDGKRFPLEAHFVHHDSKFNSADEAAINSIGDGVVVFATLFKLSEYDNTHLNGLINNLLRVKFAGETYNGTTPFVLSKILPNLQDGSAYYIYDGSFTTPPCTESVRWVVFSQTVPISERQLQSFRKLQAIPKSSDPKKDHPLVNNYRPTQELNSRKMYFSELPLAW